MREDVKMTNWYPNSRTTNQLDLQKQQFTLCLDYLTQIVLSFNVMLQSAITFILRSFSDSGSEWVIMRAPSPAAAASEAPVTKGIWFNTSMELNKWLTAFSHNSVLGQRHQIKVP